MPVPSLPYDLLMAEDFGWDGIQPHLVSEQELRETGHATATLAYNDALTPARKFLEAQLEMAPHE